ncbi:MAG: exodeoxyribonuclease III [Immundisolibacter sp.]|nr:exodeoxyribonuclease III [Immundisolibacter sp.]MDD3651122.1 exodeoxyribonuclease III [Immundisolibacter sp.]
MPLKIITLNANGIRSAWKKGLPDFLAREQADLVCLQETKAQRAQLSADQLAPPGYQGFFHDAVKPGYSGVAIYARRPPDRVVEGLGWPDFDAEGRWLQVDYGRLSVVSLYLPSGSSSEARQQVKFDVMARLTPRLEQMLADGRDWIICGDINIAHKTIDIKNWRGNQKNSGFLPEERAWLDLLFDQLGWVDAFRVVNQDADQYTWWSNRGQAWAKNVGWRIDYQIVSPGLRDAVRSARIHKDERFSDHAPLIVEYALDLR